MRTFGLRIGLLAALLGVPAAVPAGAPTWVLGLEAGGAFNTYNEVQVPGETGTRFSLTGDLGGDPALYGRLRLTHRLAARQAISLLVAPLRLSASGRVAHALDFAGTVFPAGVSLAARYRFDSYRVTYRYTVLPGARWRLALGFTGKVRDAEIRLAGGGRRARTRNTGFVPLLHLRLSGRLGPRWQLLVTVDALAAPQGRAEDLFLGLAWDLERRVRLHAGYRLLEGGADVESVYNFALIHYAALGVEIDWK